MWSSEDFPGASSVPWQLLIRARYVHEIDAVVASIAVAAISAVAAERFVEEMARSASDPEPERAPVPASPEHKLSALSAIADFEDWCGTLPRHWWGPGPRPRYIDQLGDPIASLVIDRAAVLVERAGSGDLRSGLGAALRRSGEVERQLAA
jgi:hypothetical protein